MKTTLYTGDDCPVCNSAKSIIKERDLDIEIIHIDPQTRAGRDIQAAERIMGIPVLKKGEERYVGQEVIEELLQYNN